MKVFCSYAYTGEDERAVRERMDRVVAALKENGHDVYCNLFDDGTIGFVNPEQFMHRALAILPSYDVVLVIQASARRSEGLLMEVGAALALHKQIILAQHESSVGQTYLPALANRTETWRNSEELCDIARNLLPVGAA